MGYTLRLAVSTQGNRDIARRVRAAIRKAGGAVDPAGEAREGRQVMAVRIGSAALVHPVVCAVERVRGAAVLEVLGIESADASGEEREGVHGGEARV